MYSHSILQYKLFIISRDSVPGDAHLYAAIQAELCEAHMQSLWHDLQQDIHAFNVHLLHPQSNEILARGVIL